MKNTHSPKETRKKARKELKSIIESIAGTITDLGQCLEDAGRKTGVNVAMIKIQKSELTYDDINELLKGNKTIEI